MNEKSHEPQISIFQPLDVGQKIRVRIEGENIAELFEAPVPAVNEHLKNLTT